MAPDALPEPIAVAVLVAAKLDRIGIAYVIGGSFASSVHGEPRSTNDIDMVVDLLAVDIDAFIDAMGPEWYISRDAVVEAVRTGGAFNLIHMPTALKVDMFVVGFDVQVVSVRGLRTLARQTQECSARCATAQPLCGAATGRRKRRAKPRTLVGKALRDAENPKQPAQVAAQGATMGERKSMTRVGYDPTTYGLKVRCSTS